jgi:predicted O-methyltransferase YrrM
MISFVGDLSQNDAIVLSRLGDQFKKILEFGVGGSTQIFAQCEPDILHCIDTEQYWIDRTEKNLHRLSYDGWKRPNFSIYSEELPSPGQMYNLIFVDGVPEKRLEFAMKAWPALESGGVMVFHDTRRFEYFKEAAWVMQSFFGEIRNVAVNPSSSNLTVIHKGKLLQYENWNLNEGKPMWAYGKGEMPTGGAI